LEDGVLVVMAVEDTREALVEDSLEIPNNANDEGQNGKRNKRSGERIGRKVRKIGTMVVDEGY
jgi:hypothetical protein